MVSLLVLSYKTPRRMKVDETNLGLYEQQDPEQQDLNLRGKFITDSEGRYAIYCLRPTPYPVSLPDDVVKRITLCVRTLLILEK